MDADVWLLGTAAGGFAGSGKSPARFGDSPSAPAPRKLSDLECALRGAGHAVTSALERAGLCATSIPCWLGGRRPLPASTGSANGRVSQRRCLKTLISTAANTARKILHPQIEVGGIRHLRNHPLTKKLALISKSCMLLTKTGGGQARSLRRRRGDR